MNPFHNQSTPHVMRLRVWLALLGVAVLVSVVGVLQRRASETQAATAAPAAVARFRLEERGARFYRRGETQPFTGWVTDYHKDGKLHQRSAVVDGKLHGLSEGWFPDGNAELKEHFQNGLPDGPRTTWHANGQKRSEGQLVAGQQQGRYRQWDETNRLMAEAEFKNGKPHGLSRTWYPSGCLKAEALMRNGEVQARQFYPDGIQRESTLIAKASTQ